MSDFDVIMAHHTPWLISFIKSKIGEGEGYISPEDLVAEVWVRVLKYPPSPFTKAWLRVVASNVCKNYLRRRAKERELFEPILVPDETPLDDGDDLGTPEPSVPSKEPRILAAVDLKKIPQSLRHILELRCIQGLSFKAIGARLGCSENAAGIRYRKNIKKARRILGG